MRLHTRTLLLVSALAVALLATALGYLLVPHAIGHEVIQRLDPGQLSGLRGAIHGLVLWTGAIAVVIAVLYGALVGRGLARSLGAVRRRIAALPSTGGGPIPTLVTEIAALDDAARRSGQEIRGRLAQLERQRDEVSAVLDAVGEGILQLDASGRIVRLNTAVRRLLGLAPDAVGRPYGSVVRNVGVREALARALRTGSAVPGEIAVDDRRVYFAAEPLRAGAPGSGAPASATGISAGAPVRVAPGLAGPAARTPAGSAGSAGSAAGPEPAARAPDGVVVVLVDITELRRLEAVRRDFVANASHELKTPLTSIRGYAETLLADDNVPADMRRDFLGTIHDNAARLQRIVDDLLDLSRYESGAWVPSLETVDVLAAARDAWKPLAKHAEERAVAFDAEQDGRWSVRADPMALRQIFTNLFDNALRYTSSGGRIRVRAVAESPAAGEEAGRGDVAPEIPGAVPAGTPRRGGRVRIEVSDTGSGIPRESLGRIFERFYRVDPARSRAEGGTGLGLSIVKHLVEKMGGAVGVESELGKGTTVRFSLPAGPSTPRAA